MAKNDKSKKGKGNKGEAATKDEEAQAKGGKGKLIIIIVAALLVLGGGGGGAAFFLLGGSSGDSVAEGGAAQDDEALAQTSSKGDPLYVDLDPDFTVNMDLDETTRFVQVAISLLTYFDETEEAIKDNLPILRNNIILMIGQRTSDELATTEGKNRLQEEIHDEVMRVLSENSAGSVIDIEKVFFTKFVMQ